MRRDQPEKVVLVCAWNGQPDRFFGKYKVFGTTKWSRIPGGVFPPQFDTKEKALLFANEWYAQAKIEHAVQATLLGVGPDLTWDAICDAYLSDVKARKRGKDATRHEAITVVNANIRRGVLATGHPTENDETRCVVWLRSIASENIAKSGTSLRTRKPKTIRNIAKQLRYVFKFAVRRKLIPGLTTNPTLGEEFKEELKAIMDGDMPIEWFVPVNDFKKLVSCAPIPALRRLAYLAMGLAGLRPGELAGLQVKHLMRDGDVRYISVEQQFTEKRPGQRGGKIDSLKTKWSRRNVPLHRALVGPLDEWLSSGWEEWVGREPEAEDFIFPDAEGKPYRRHDADGFRDDLTDADCLTIYNDQLLKPYALRHTFSTMLQDGHAHDAAHDRLMGHRPKDTKTLNYSVKQLPFLAAEIEKIAFDLPAEAPNFGAKRRDGEEPRGVLAPEDVG